MSDLSWFLLHTRGSFSQSHHNRHTHFHLIPRLLHRLVFNSSHLQAIKTRAVGRPRNVATHTMLNYMCTPTNSHTYIHRLESLLPLAGLVHLKNLSLKLPGTKLTNPVCSIASYEAFMQDTFPLLIWLNGEKVLGPGSEFYSRCVVAWNGGINLLVPWRTVLYCDILWYIVVYCDILWYTWYTVIYCGIL